MDKVLSKIQGVTCRLKSQDIGLLSSYVRNNNVRRLLEKMLHLNRQYRGIWNDREGVEVLRRLATVAASLNYRDMVMVMVTKLEVEPHCFPDEDLIYTSEKHEEEDAICTPLIGALYHEDLAMDLLALVPKGDECLSETNSENQDLLMLSIIRKATHVARELLVTHEVVIDNHSLCGHSALCLAATKGDTQTMCIMLGEYKSQHRLREALEIPCDPNQECENCTAYPLMYHVKTVEMARLLMVMWGAEIPLRKKGVGLPVHRVAFKCNLPLLKFYLETCGLALDEIGKGDFYTPLWYACTNANSTDAQLLPIVEYLLKNGASTKVRGYNVRPPWKVAMDNGKPLVHDLILAAHRACMGEVDSIRNHDFGFDADKDADEVVVVAGTGGRRKKGKKSGKKKRKARLRKVGESDVGGAGSGEEDSAKDGEESVGEMATDLDGLDLDLVDLPELIEETVVETVVDHNLVEVVADLTDVPDLEFVEPIVETVVDLIVEPSLEPFVEKSVDPIVESFQEPFVDSLVNCPQEYLCAISRQIMTEPVIAMDGHSYEKSEIEAWISSCVQKGMPVTSPATNMPMPSNMLIPNLPLRNLVRAFLGEV